MLLNYRGDFSFWLVTNQDQWETSVQGHTSMLSLILHTLFIFLHCSVYRWCFCCQRIKIRLLT